jgi:hypothetical protein
MKSFILIFIIFDLILINSFTQRNLKFTINDKAYKILSQAAVNVFKQVYNLTIDFEGRLHEARQNDKMKLEVVIYDDVEIPNVNQKIRFNVTNKSATIPDIAFEKTEIELFEDYYDVKEKFKIFVNMIANSFHNGFVIIYKKNDEGIVPNSRFKCFVEEDGQLIGSFEMIQVNIKFKDQLIKALEKYFGDVVKSVAEKLVSQLITSIIGIMNSMNSASSFLKIPYFVLFFIICLFD